MYSYSNSLVYSIYIIQYTVGVFRNQTGECFLPGTLRVLCCVDGVKIRCERESPRELNEESSRDGREVLT